jgi:hypothetical protein
MAALRPILPGPIGLCCHWSEARRKFNPPRSLVARYFRHAVMGGNHPPPSPGFHPDICPRVREHAPPCSRRFPHRRATAPTDRRLWESHQHRCLDRSENRARHEGFSRLGNRLLGVRPLLLLATLWRSVAVRTARLPSPRCPRCVYQPTGDVVCRLVTIAAISGSRSG